MLPVKYIPLKSILVNLFSTIDESIQSYREAVEWAAYAMEKLETQQTLQEDIFFLAVEDYKAQLACGTKYIWQIWYKEVLNSSDIDQIIVYVSEDGTITQSPMTFLNTTYFQSTWRPLRLSTTPFNRLVHCANSPSFYNICEHSYSVDKNSIVTTSFQTGYLAVARYGYPMKDGDFLIPDEVDVLEAIRYYVLMRHWEKRMNRKEQGAAPLYSEYKSQWSLFSAKARGKLLLPSLDGLENLKQQLLRIGQHTQNYYSAFGNLAVGETLKF